MKNIHSLLIMIILGLTACDNGEVTPDNDQKNGNTDTTEVEYTIVDPCMTGDENCLESIPIKSEAGRTAVFNFYRNYPIMNDTAKWGNIKQAVFVVHGQNRDADNYFNFMTSSLNSSNIMDSTLLISPHFKNNSQVGPGELFWPNDWRSGALSGNPSVKISTYSLLDSLIDIISNKDQFPFLEKIIITGHSSGALFTHTYALASEVEELYEIDFDYIVANSQYFYYPLDVRYDANSDSFTTPNECENYNDWPFGFESPVEYIASKNREELNEKFIRKKITYLLGTSDTQTSGSLNTNNCAAVLLGEHRFNRGENMQLLMETFYQNEHNHQKKLVQNIGHNGNSMYNSNSYKELMLQIFSE
ncbi:hypothetical protein [Marivirga sp.]|uniref:hypothetical protein n=1 Tax=Marivirga sp. TaxID=2018662 RepID=UPI003DA75601